MPIPRRTIDIPWHDFAAKGLLRSTDQRIQRRRHVTAAPLTVSSGVSVSDIPLKRYFIDTEVTRAWNTTCRTT
ncbi:MAG TPA: hypothetical protein VEW66_08495 [Thermomicrobiales bacterium]|nr:hypothetical protein [Thermomicrobiales bacterium]